jgi:hypothetical protein
VNNTITPLITEAHRLIGEAINYFALTVPKENIVVTIQSKGRKKAVGWFWHGRWTGESKKQANALHEINMSAEHLKDYHMGELLLHELAHAENDHQGIKDCAGRRHNKKFKVMAERLGLKVEKGGSVGFGVTDLGDLAKEFLNKIKFDRSLFELCRLVAEPKGAAGSRLLKCECPGCGYVVRTTAKWLAVGLPVCPCGETMEAAEVFNEP